MINLLFFKTDFTFYFLEREEGREKEKHQCVVASHAPPLGTWPATQACALTGNQTSNLLVCRPVLSPLSLTSQGIPASFYPPYVGVGPFLFGFLFLPTSLDVASSLSPEL